jgi:outer membrane protein insertion porin family
LTSTPSSVPLKTDILYFAPKVGFPLSRDSELIIKYSFDQEDVKATTNKLLLSPTIRGDVGKKNKSALTFTYYLDKTNSVVTPTSGYDFKIIQEFNGLGGDISFSKSNLNFKTYRTIIRDDIIISTDLSSGFIVGTDASIMNRFTLGGDRLKGFRNQGIGPYDSKFATHLGGKMYTSLSLEASFPIGIPEEYGIYGGVFLDTGSLWGLDNTDTGRIDDSSEIRSSLGFSIFWESAIGPLRFNWSSPIKKETYDVTENFRFTIDTRF